jgi:hypothetical protein
MKAIRATQHFRQFYDHILKVGDANSPMLHYFYLLNGIWFANEMQPALAESWRRRSFAPCLPLCRELAGAACVADDAVVRLILGGLAYDRALWHAFVGECLIYGAEAMPRLTVAPAALCCFLAPERLGADPLDTAAPSSIEQMHFGARDLRFGGGWHRPDHVGWNDAADVERLLQYARAVDPQSWSAAALAPLKDLTDDGEREEELAYVRDWWPALLELYEQAHAARQVIVCERS